jgi:hypothetical protein
MKYTVGITGAVAVCALAGYFLYWHTYVALLPAHVPPQTEPATEALIPPRVAPAGMHEYHNTTYRLSLFYPETLGVKEFDEGEGAATIIFQNPEEGRGFQIFVVPFSGTQITAERFKKDIPSGVRKELKDITIDGATGASFYSTNAMLGDTAEVWFIHGNYLFEVTTLKSLDTWLAGIMQTWKFF